MMFKILYSVFIFIFEMLIAYAFFSKNYKRRISSNIITLTIGIIFFTMAALSFEFFNNRIINTIVFYVINLLFGTICYKIPLKSCLLQSAFLEAILYSSELIPVFFLSALMKIPTGAYENSFMVYMLFSSISTILYLVFSQILAIFITKENFTSFKIKYFLPLFLFPVLALVTLSVFHFIALETNLSNIYQVLISVISVLFLASSVFIFIYFQSLIEKERKINELESEQKINTINETYLNILEQQNDELQMMFHDTKHHYMTLGNLESVSDIKAYIEKLYPILENKNKVRVSNNRIIDVIINKYTVLCKTKNVKFNYEVKTADLKYIDNVELSAILNNALDNAVEAAETSSEKTIELSIRHINNMDLLSIVNSCDAAPNHKHGKLKTIKEQPESHGFGSRIIERHTKANNGTYEWFYDDLEKKFHLTLVFQN